MSGTFSQKISGFSCDLTTLWKIKQLCAKAVETQLGVTGTLHVVLVQPGKLPSMTEKSVDWDV